MYCQRSAAAGTEWKGSHIDDEQVVCPVYFGIFVDNFEDRVGSHPVIRVEVSGGVAVDIVLERGGVIRSDELQALD